MTRVLTVLSAVFLFLALPAAAEDNPVVVELFTSQGCSSCPPADEWLLGMTGRRDVLALALHVDYWDYIGWKDRFADPRYSERQRAYASHAGRRMVYTPQMIVNGLDSVEGFKHGQLKALIRQSAAAPKLVVLRAVREGNVVTIEANRRNGLKSGPLLVQIVRFQPRREIDITRGENAGRHMAYGNVVEDWAVIGEWDGSEPLAMQTRISGSHPAAIVIQRAGPGAILAAARLD